MMATTDKHGQTLPFAQAQELLKRERADVRVLADWAADVFGLDAQKRELLAEQYDKRLVMGGRASVLSYSLAHLTRHVSEGEIRARVKAIGQGPVEENGLDGP